MNVFDGDIGKISGIMRFVLLAYGLATGLSGFATIFNKNKIPGFLQRFASFSLILLIPGVIGALLTAAIIKLSSVAIIFMLLAALGSFVLLLLNPE